MTIETLIDQPATLRNYAAKSRIYNINVKNTYGQGHQALALSAYNTEQGYYGCQFIGFQGMSLSLSPALLPTHIPRLRPASTFPRAPISLHTYSHTNSLSSLVDTVLAETGYQVYAKCYIEGAVDFIFGQTGNAWFHDCDIGLVTYSTGTITAQGRPSSSSSGYFVINGGTVKAAPGHTVAAGSYALGRPWTEYARVVFQKTNLSAAIKSAGWDVWSSSSPNTADVLFGEYSNTGSGASGTRASFAKKLSSAVSISSILGSGYTSWVDTSYLS